MEASNDTVCKDRALPLSPHPLDGQSPVQKSDLEVMHPDNRHGKKREEVMLCSRCRNSTDCFFRLESLLA